MLAGPARHLLLSTASVMVLALLGASSYAQAQQVVANGTTQTASGTINTGVLPPTAGYDLYSLNGGVIQSFSPFTLRTGGAGSHAVAAESGGAITIFSGSSVTTTGTNATGLAATGANSTITAANLTLSATSVGSFGAAATDGALISLTGGTITSTSSALRVANGGNINATNLNLTATVGGAIGVNADNGTITLTGGTVTAIVGSTAGINASGANGLVNANSVNVNASSNGVQAVTGATLTFSNGTIAGTAIGVRASSGGTTSVDSSTINLAAAGTRGALQARQHRQYQWEHNPDDSDDHRQLGWPGRRPCHRCSRHNERHGIVDHDGSAERNDGREQHDRSDRRWWRRPQPDQYADPDAGRVNRRRQSRSGGDRRQQHSRLRRRLDSDAVARVVRRLGAGWRRYLAE